MSATAVRVLKRDQITTRPAAENQLATLRRAMDEEIATAVREQVAAAEEARASSQATAHISAMRGAADAISAAATALPAQLSASVERMAEDLIEAAAVLTEWLCSGDGPAARDWTGTLGPRIVSALGQLTDNDSVVIRVSERDASALAEAADHAFSGIEIRADPSLQPGDALITTASGDADLTLRTALKRAVDVLTGRAAAALTDHRDLG